MNIKNWISIDYNNQHKKIFGHRESPGHIFHYGTQLLCKKIFGHGESPGHIVRIPCNFILTRKSSAIGRAQAS